MSKIPRLKLGLKIVVGDKKGNSGSRFKTQVLA